MLDYCLHICQACSSVWSVCQRKCRRTCCGRAIWLARLSRHLLGQPAAILFGDYHASPRCTPDCNCHTGVNVLSENTVASFILVNIIFLLGTFTFAVVLGVVSDDLANEVKASSFSAGPLAFLASAIRSSCPSHLLLSRLKTFIRPQMVSRILLGAHLLLMCKILPDQAICC